MMKSKTAPINFIRHPRGIIAVQACPVQLPSTHSLYCRSVNDEAMILIHGGDTGTMTSEGEYLEWVRGGYTNTLVLGASMLMGEARVRIGIPHLLMAMRISDDSNYLYECAYRGVGLTLADYRKQDHLLIIAAEVIGVVPDKVRG